MKIPSVKTAARLEEFNTAPTVNNPKNYGMKESEKSSGWADCVAVVGNDFGTWDGSISESVCYNRYWDDGDELRLHQYFHRMAN